MKKPKKPKLTQKQWDECKKQWNYTEKKMQEIYRLEYESEIQMDFIEKATVMFPDLVFQANKNESNLQRKKLKEAGFKDSHLNAMQAKMNSKAAKMGVQKGFPDITVLAEGNLCFFLEFKRTKSEKLKEHQEAWAEKIRSLGFEVFLVCSVEEALKIVKNILDISKTPN